MPDALAQIIEELLHPARGIQRELLLSLVRAEDGGA
jgi:hypothetical protein